MDEHDDYDTLIRDKGRRARRRELEATREPGHLHKWFERQGWPEWYDGQHDDVWRQIMRSFKHSCHSACCAIDQYFKRHDNRVSRQKMRQELKNEAAVDPTEKEA